MEDLQTLSGDPKLIRITANMGYVTLSEMTTHTCVVITNIKGVNMGCLGGRVC